MANWFGTFLYIFCSLQYIQLKQLGLVSGQSSFSICAAGQIYSAAQGAKTTQCNVCSSYFQCVGAYNAVTKCQNSTTDTATATSITTGSGWATFLSTYIGITVDTTASAAGLAFSNCNTLYGTSCPTYLAGSCGLNACISNSPVPPPPGPPRPHGPHGPHCKGAGK